MSVLATDEMSAVETRQMSSVETGQMSAAETGQMSSVAKTDICPVSTHTKLKSQKSQLWHCHNVQVSEISIVQIADMRSGPKSTKMVRNGSRMVARS